MKITPEKNTFTKLFDVSRETLAKLTQYELKIISFNEKSNIIGKSTIPKIWQRHFADSAKIFSLITKVVKNNGNKKLTICDVGSGGGFPGLIILILNQEKKVNFCMTLVESNKKKCSFLKDLTKILKVKAEVINNRAENLNEKYDIITGRAVAPLPKFLMFCRNIRKDKTIYILPKGSNFQSELLQLKKQWYYDVNIVKNNKEIDKSGGVTIVLSNLKKK